RLRARASRGAGPCSPVAVDDEQAGRETAVQEPADALPRVVRGHLVALRQRGHQVAEAARCREQLEQREARVVDAEVAAGAEMQDDAFALDRREPQLGVTPEQRGHATSFVS